MERLYTCPYLCWGFVGGAIKKYLSFLLCMLSVHQKVCEYLRMGRNGFQSHADSY